MSRSRQLVGSALGLAGIAALVAGAAVWLQPARAAVGPVPPAALALPGDAAYVMGLDVRRLVASPLYQKRLSARLKPRPGVLAEIEEKTGLAAERDVDALVLAGAAGAQPSGVAVAVGRFDSEKLRAALRARPGLATRRHQGVAVFSYDAGGTRRSLAVLDDHALVIGEDALVRRTLDNRERADAGVGSNAALVARLERVRPGATFWLVGDGRVLGELARLMPGPGPAGAGGSLSLPALQQVVVSGDVEPQLALDVTGDAADEAGARNLADMLRGFIALFSMQAAQRPELARLAGAFNVTQAAHQVSVAVRIPPELLDALEARPPAAGPEAR
jgi:hypothetical protein